MARCMLLYSNLEYKFWGETVNTVNYLQNRLSTKPTSLTPSEYWNKRALCLHHIKTFDCTAFVHIPDINRRKLDRKATKLIFIGYSEESQNYRLLDTWTNQITFGRDAIFIEDKHFPYNII